jgi:DNA-directed RNA polymerase specialized sigma24 family protein
VRWPEFVADRTALVASLVRAKVPPRDCQDVTQDALLAALQTVPWGAPGPRWNRLLQIITSRAVADYYRFRPPPTCPLERNAAAGGFRTVEDRLRLVDALARLPRLDACVLWSQACGFTAREIGQRLGTSEQAVWWRASNARRQLHK